MERRYIESRLWTCLTSAFLEQVRSRYHFEEKDKALLKGVASDLAGCLKWKEAAYLMFEDGTDTVRRATAVVMWTCCRNATRTPGACWKAICLRVSAENF